MRAEQPAVKRGTSDTPALAGSQPPAAASDTAAAYGGQAAQPPPRPGKKATQIPPAYTAAYDAYARELSRPGGPLDADIVRAYLSRVRQFLAWLPGADTSGDPLADPAARDGAARDYRAFLLTVAKRKASTVNAHLTAIDDFFRHRGLGPAAAKRQELPRSPPAPWTDASSPDGCEPSSAPQPGTRPWPSPSYTPEPGEGRP